MIDLEKRCHNHVNLSHLLSPATTVKESTQYCEAGVAFEHRGER